MSTKAVVPESSPALEQVDLDVPSGDAYEHWRKTGELPSSDAEVEEVERKQREEEEKAQKPSQEEEASAASEGKSVTRAGSEPAKKAGIKRDGDSRIRQLTEDLKREREEKQRLLERLTAAPASEKAGVKAEGSPTQKPDTSKVAEPDPNDKDEKGEAKYKTWGEYQKAHDKWVFDESERRAAAAFDRISSERKQTETQQQREQSWKKRIGAARKAHEDFDDVALNPQLPIGAWAVQKDGKLELSNSSPIMDYLNESELGAEMAYYLGQNPDVVKEMTGLELRDGGWFYTGQRQTLAQIHRKLAMIELSLLPDEDEHQETRTAPVKRVTAAPPPPRQVVGKPPQTLSEEAQALKDDDFEAYASAATRREVAARKGRK